VFKETFSPRKLLATRRTHIVFFLSFHHGGAQIAKCGKFNLVYLQDNILHAFSILPSLFCAKRAGTDLDKPAVCR
jgi:hypothetical protein